MLHAYFLASLNAKYSYSGEDTNQPSQTVAILSASTWFCIEVELKASLVLQSQQNTRNVSI